MKKHILGVVLLAAITTLGNAQDFESRFFEYLQAGDSAEMHTLLNQWEGTHPTDPELSVAWFNFYFWNAPEEVLQLMTGEDPTGQGLSFADSTGKHVGYITSSMAYNPEMVQLGLQKIDEGIERYPKRLDMRFGKIHVLHEIGAWDLYTEEILKTIQYSVSIEHAWTWTHGEPTPGNQAYFLGNIQDYQYRLFNTGDDSLLPNMRTIGEQVLAFYPDDVPSLSNVAISYMLEGDFDRSIEVFMRAYEIDPSDAVVINNIAHAYKLKGSKKKSIKYYKKLIAVGSEEDIAWANEQIAELEQ
ncbi:hypothetical protein [Pontibacter sp. G13]|uniref:tetratricopeptide repeat protein n=1 Tax=Pontibacter sp. G13 TaxID=3074898 RepID=UPI00288BF619|nr:hypothetical protein [Pontibacter sp. G13]WNJ19476.1 hypothetical protein RJD25_03195 [Pontibacter sp. G13]